MARFSHACLTGVCRRGLSLAQPIASLSGCAGIAACHTPPMTQQSNLKAALWMAGSIASFLVMSVAGRGDSRPRRVPGHGMRSVIGCFILLPLVFVAGGFRGDAHQTAAAAYRPQRRALCRPGRVALRADHDPARRTVSIEFTTPIWTRASGGPLPRRKMSRARIAAIVLGLVGISSSCAPAYGRPKPAISIVLGAARRLRHFAWSW